MIPTTPGRAVLLVTLAFVLALPPASADPAEAETGSGDVVAELQELVRTGRCEEALSRIGALGGAAASNPDLLVLEANCLVLGAGEGERVFDGVLYERVRLALGAERMPPELSKSFYRNEIKHDPEVIARAEELFGRALDAAPDRADLVVGAVAMFAQLGRPGPALEIVRRHADALGREDLPELGKIVEDQLVRRRIDVARTLADGLAEALPERAEPEIARGRASLAEHRALPAIAAFARAHELARHNQAVTAELNRLRLIAGRSEEAVSGLIPVSSSSPVFQMWLGLARSIDSPLSARRIWDELRKQIDHPHMDDEAKILVQHYSRLLGTDQVPPPAMRLRGAQAFDSRGMTLPAAVEAWAALEADPTLVEGWVFLSRLHRRGMLFDLALADLERAIAAAEALPEASRSFEPSELTAWKAEVLLGLGELEKAWETCEEVDGTPHARPYVAALAATGLGRTDEARRLLEGIVAEGGEKAAAARARLDALVN